VGRAARCDRRPGAGGSAATLQTPARCCPARSRGALRAHRRAHLPRGAGARAGVRPAPGARSTSHEGPIQGSLCGSGPGPAVSWAPGPQRRPGSHRAAAARLTPGGFRSSSDPRDPYIMASVEVASDIRGAATGPGPAGFSQPTGAVGAKPLCRPLLLRGCQQRTRRPPRRRPPGRAPPAVRGPAAEATGGTVTATELCRRRQVVGTKIVMARRGAVDLVASSRRPTIATSILGLPVPPDDRRCLAYGCGWGCRPTVRTTG
jgi:hypothetical protein